MLEQEARTGGSVLLSCMCQAGMIGNVAYMWSAQTLDTQNRLRHTDRGSSLENRALSFSSPFLTPSPSGDPVPAHLARAAWGPQQPWGAGVLFVG